MLKEKYSYQIKKGEFQVRKVFILEEGGKDLVEFLEDPRLEPEATSFRCHGPYYDSEEEVQEYIKTLIPTDDEINKVIGYLDLLPARKFKELKERLDYEICFNDEEDTEGNMLSVMSDLTEPIRLLLSGFLVINGESIRISDIQAVKWGGDRIYGMEETMNSCEVILRDGNKKTPTSLLECWLLCILFGHNYGDRFYPGIHCEFESKFIHKYDSKDGGKD